MLELKFLETMLQYGPGGPGGGMGWGGHGMGWGGGYGMGIFMMIFMVLLLVILAGALIKLFSGSSSKKSESEEGQDAIEILRKRYARGEIDKQEFEEKKKDLGN